MSQQFRTRQLAAAAECDDEHLTDMMMRYTFWKLRGRHLGFCTYGHFRHAVLPIVPLKWPSSYMLVLARVAVEILFLSHLEVEICLGIF